MADIIGELDQYAGGHRQNSAAKVRRRRSRAQRAGQCVTSVGRSPSSRLQGAVKKAEEGGAA